jgi:hypothetical protein
MGAPLGSRNAAKGKAWFDALRKECVQRQALEALATLVVDKALRGDWQAIQEVANRFDGKPAQSVAVDASLNATINWPLPKPPLEP